MRKRVIAIALLAFTSNLSLTRAEEPARLLFAYSPGCPHCQYQQPIINQFKKQHPEIRITQVNYNSLNARQRGLIEGTSGHPVMVFYQGDCLKQVVGETPLEQLREEYVAFQQQCGGSVEIQKTTGGSGIVCH